MLMRTMTSAVVVMALAACGAEGDGATAQAIAGPGGVTVTVRAVDQLAVSWTAVPTASKYYVYQGPDAQHLAYVASVTGAPPATSYIATGIASGLSYCFAISSGFGDGSESDLSEAMCSGGGGGGTPAAATHVPLTIFTSFGWTQTVVSFGSGPQAFIESTAAGAAFVWLPATSGARLRSVTFAAEGANGQASLTSVKVLRFFKDGAGAQPVGAIAPGPSLSASWSDVALDAGAALVGDDSDLAIQFDAATPGVRVKNIRAVFR